MGERTSFLREMLGSLSEEGIILMNILEVQEEILDELRAQNTIEDDEEQGPTSLSDP